VTKLNANFDFQYSSNANANRDIYFISGKSECSALVTRSIKWLLQYVIS